LEGFLPTNLRDHRLPALCIDLVLDHRHGLPDDGRSIHHLQHDCVHPDLLDLRTDLAQIPLMTENWIEQMLEATWPEKSSETDIETVEQLVLPKYQWSMGDYENLLAYFELETRDFTPEDRAIYNRMIAVNRMIVSLLKTGRTNEF
tara:strand:- start:278 stop:715 length:438 start_codon:yes stop_codon:yes gene_type:complete